MGQPNIGIIGIGHWGKKLVKEFNEVSNIQICLTTGSNENTKWLSDNYPRIRYTQNLDEILNSPEIDAVVIATPISTHYDLAKSALIRGKSVFLEKPPVTSSTQMSDLLELANQKSLLLFVDQVFLYHPVFLKIKEISKTEKIKSMDFSWMKFGSFKEDLYWNLAYHDIYLILDLLNDIQEIKISSRSGILTNVDITSLNIKLKDNIDISLYYNRISNIKDKSCTIKTDKNNYLWQNDNLFIINPDNTLEEIPHPTNLPLTDMIQDFITKLDNNNSPSTTISSIRAVQIISELLN